MDYWIEREDMPVAEYMIGIQRFKLMAGDRNTFARDMNRRDAALLRQAMSLLEGMADQFPGLIDRETDVNGGDLVDFFNVNFEKFRTLHSYLAGDGGYQDDEEIYDPELEDAHGDGSGDGLRGGGDAEVDPAATPCQDADDGC